MGSFNSKEMPKQLKERIESYKYRKFYEYSSLAVKIKFSYKVIDKNNIKSKFDEMKTIGTKLTNIYHPTSVFLTHQEIDLIFKINQLGFDRNKLIVLFTKELIKHTDLDFSINLYSVPNNETEINYKYLELYNFIYWRYICFNSYMKQFYPDLENEYYILIKNNKELLNNKEFNTIYTRYASPFNIFINFNSPFKALYKYIMIDNVDYEIIKKLS